MSADHLQRAYGMLVNAMRVPRKKAALEEAVQRAVREVREALVEMGGDPDAPWVQRRAIGMALPSTLHVTPETDTDGTTFLIAHEDGVVGLDDGQRVGTYHLESTGIVKVTTELLAEAT